MMRYRHYLLIVMRRLLPSADSIDFALFTETQRGYARPPSTEATLFSIRPDDFTCGDFCN